MVISIEEISISVSIPSLIKDSFIRSGKFSVLDNGDYEMSTGGFSVVFPVIVGDEKWAFRCWHVTIDKAMERYKLLSQTLPSYKLPYFIDFYYEEKGIVVSGITYPTIRMRWVNGKNIKDYIGRNLNDSEKIFRLADRFLKMVRVLHKSSIAHGDLQHENIMVNTRGNLVLIDYDSLFLPELRGIADEDIIAGKPDYQHPCRKKNKIASQKIDYFSEVVILLGILGIARDKTLWEKYHVAGSDGLLFSKDDYYNLKESRIYSDLYRFGHPFSDLLDILCTYLQSADINQLEPLESFGIFADESLDLVQYFEEQRAQEKDTVLWAEVSRIDTKQSYIKYLSVFPNGKYSDIAERKIYKIEEKEKKAAEITKRDNEAWHNAYTVGTVESYTKYLQDFPSGVHAKDAKARIETIYWNNAREADTVESYQSYLTHFSYGAYTTRAKNRIKQIEEELKLWNYAEKEKTISSYNLYLKKYPGGKHKDEANRRIKSLTERLKRRKRIRKAVVSILCCALLILSVFVGPSIVKYINQNSSGEAVKNSQLVRPVDVSALENINIVRDLMNKGRYEDALTIIEGLNVVQNDRYSEDLARIERIKNLYNNALSYYKKDYYSRAITNYEEIIKIYNSLSFYVDKSFINSKISVCKKARAEYLQKQQEKLLAEERERARQDSIMRVREQARQVWEETLRANTIDAYERYLKTTARQSDENVYYRQIAITNLRSLYVRAAMGNYLENNFVEAYWYFNKLETKYGDLNSSEQAIYDRCRMERDYRSLLSVDTPPYWYEDFLKQFPSSKYSSDVRGRLCLAYCRNGLFDKASALVQSGKSMELDGEIKTVSWWNTYIKRQKKVYKKELKKDQRKNR